MIVGVAAFISVFCLVASKAVFSQNSYQSRLTKAEQTTLAQLQTNQNNLNQLTTAYKAFVGSSQNVIGGSAIGIGGSDGNNKDIVLDALPSSYDFPALVTSIEKILTSQNLNINGISGNDDELAQQSNTSSPAPQPLAIPFAFEITNANYPAVQLLIKTLQSSIRPIQIDNMQLSGGTDSMQLSINAHTYYQPAKTITISKEVIR
jgi:Tfp pilus assembly protein PilO